MCEHCEQTTEGAQLWATLLETTHRHAYERNFASDTAPVVKEAKARSDAALQAYYDYHMQQQEG